MLAMIISVTVVVIAIMFVIFERQSIDKVKRLLKQTQENSINLEQKLQNLREELKHSKNELEREKISLKEARELAKKKLQRAQSENIIKTSSEANMIEKDDKEKAILAMETQIEQLKKEQHDHESVLKEKLALEFSQKEHELKNKINELQEEIKKQKRLMRPEGCKIDLKTLPDEAAAEFARVFRKADQHERLHGIARAKLHLAQEKFAELQKRYFTVCRELALLADSNKTDNNEVKESNQQENI